MNQTGFDTGTFKSAMKEAVVEALHEQRDLLHEVFAEVLEDFALAEAIREGQKTPLVSHEEVLQILQGQT
jgi:hypothetical protein